MRFHCKIEDNNNKGCNNIELWKYKCYETNRNSIIPIYNIYSRFIPSRFIMGIQKLKTYMAVISINR